MAEIAHWKIYEVIKMAESIMPSTADLVKNFEQSAFRKDFYFEGMLIISEMHDELNNNKNAHKIWGLNEELIELFKRAEKNLL